MNSIKKKDGGYATSWMESAQILLDELCPDDEHGPRDEEIENELAKEYEVWEQGEPWTEEEIWKAIKRLPLQKSPGHDRIEAPMIRHAWRTRLRAHIVRLYNSCLDRSVFPRSWKHGLIRALIKSEDKDPTQPKSYRPVCLLPLTGKVLERLIRLRMSDIFGRVSGGQHGFVKGRNTETAIRDLVRRAKSTRMKYALSMFFDISGAFSNLWWLMLLLILRLRRCKRNSLRLIRSYLSDRRMTLEGVCERIMKFVTKGCPQGSVLGPELWNLLFHTLLELLGEIDWDDVFPDKNIEVGVIAYADDLAALICADSRSLLERASKYVGERIRQWLASVKMELAAHKTEVLLLKGVLKGRSPRVLIGERLIKESDKVRYLGVMLGKNLSIVGHVTYVTEKVSRMAVLTRVARAEWGLDFRSLRVLYGALYLSVATYGVGAWYELVLKTVRRTLQSSQRAALLRTVKAYRTTATAALQILANDIPIDLVLRERWLLSRQREGIETLLEGEDLARMTKAEAKKKVREVVTDEWSRRWQNETRGAMTREYFPSVQARQKAVWFEPDYYICQFIGGHGDFRARLQEFGLSETAECECGEADTPDHVMFDCEQFADERSLLAEEIGHWPVTKEQLVSKEYMTSFRGFARSALRKRQEARSKETYGGSDFPIRKFLL